jgi:hypothetical protein
MSGTLTAQEVESKYRSEWVLMGSVQTDSSLNVVQGEILGHSKDRDEVYRLANRLKPKRFAVLYTGTLPEGSEIVL